MPVFTSASVLVKSAVFGIDRRHFRIDDFEDHPIAGRIGCRSDAADLLVEDLRHFGLREPAAAGARDAVLMLQAEFRFGGERGERFAAGELLDDRRRPWRRALWRAHRPSSRR